MDRVLKHIKSITKFASIIHGRYVYLTLKSEWFRSSQFFYFLNCPWIFHHLENLAKDSFVGKHPRSSSFL